MISAKGWRVYAVLLRGGSKAWYRALLYSTKKDAPEIRRVFT